MFIQHFLPYIHCKIKKKVTLYNHVLAIFLQNFTFIAKSIRDDKMYVKFDRKIRLTKLEQEVTLVYYVDF